LILEAFSDTLNECYRRNEQSAEAVLQEWLLGYLRAPVDSSDHVSRVLHTEIGYLDPNLPSESQTTSMQGFFGKSTSGQILLESLFEYCKSYENWQFSRWLHHLRASDFPFADC
jgi:hypothetical protein